MRSLTYQADSISTRLAINCHSCVNAPQLSLQASLHLRDHKPVKEMVAAFDERRKVILSALNLTEGFSCVEPSGAFYAFPNIQKTGMKAKDLQNFLLEKAHVATGCRTAFWKKTAKVFCDFPRKFKG